MPGLNVWYQMKLLHLSWQSGHFLNDKITQAMERLPQKEQQVLTGIYLEDKSAGDLAASIDVSLGHIYRLQKQGVRRVRGMLSRLMNELNKS